MTFVWVKVYKQLPRGETTSSLTILELHTKSVCKAAPTWFNPNRNLSIHLSQNSSSGVILPLNCFNFSAHRQRMGKGLVGIVLFGLRIFKRLKAKHFVDVICLSARPIILTFVRSLELMRTKLEALASLSALKMSLNPSVLRTFHFLPLSNGNRGIWQT